MSKSDFFKDYPHEIEFSKISGRKYVQRRLADRVILKKEIIIQQYLADKGLCPAIVEVGDDYYIEEFIDGVEVGKLEMTSNILQELASVLRRLHTTGITDDIFDLLKDDYTKDHVYKPYRLLKTMVSGLPTDIIGRLLDELRDPFLEIENELGNTPYFFSIVHGDLSGSNIIRKNSGELVIIDWSDARVDIPSADVSQMFYLLKLTISQQVEFLKNYDIDFVSPQILRIHSVLLKVYDLVQLTRMGRMSLEDVSDNIELTIKQFQEYEI